VSHGAAGDDEINDEYRLTFFPGYKITDNVNGFGYVGYVFNPDVDYSSYYLETGLTYSPAKWLQIWGGLIGIYTDNEIKSDKLELRPFAGVKMFLPNDWDWRIYNFTRYEFRATEDLDTHDWSDVHRIRSRFGVEIPLGSREKAWQPQSWYALADVEPIYRFDRGTVDPLRFRAGLGYVMNNWVTLEFQYYAQFTRPNGGSLQYTDNIFRLNIKIAKQNGILNRLLDVGFDD